MAKANGKGVCKWKNLLQTDSSLFCLLAIQIIKHMTQIKLIRKPKTVTTKLQPVINCVRRLIQLSIRTMNDNTNE